ncbi:hypothetical protein CVT26_008624 [Gymnopilus dilepis]|uniref:F-box domain-containing protein n=1 Tax=Gymnopilus dilepis TaxID=231916 RepID=A0A409XXZ4_9AGAR|nr:hypothetical protein CVT26_008624 [Gymnopilus dilepis]
MARRRVAVWRRRFPSLSRKRTVPLPQLLEDVAVEEIKGSNFGVEEVAGEAHINYPNFEPAFEGSVLGLYCPMRLDIDESGILLDDLDEDTTSGFTSDWLNLTKPTNMEPLFDGSALGLYCPPSIFHLPDELLAKVVEYAMLDELEATKSVNKLLRGVRRVSARWRWTADHLVRRHRTSTSDVSEVALCGVSGCRGRADPPSLACHTFTRPLSAGTSPWLTHLSLNIALSLPNCYFLMSELSHTLQNVSFTKISSLPRSQPQDCILTLSPTLRNRGAIALPHLAALSVHSHVDIQPLLELFSFSLLTKVELHALTDDVTQNSEAETLKISAKLALPWDALIDLSLKNEDPRWRPAIGQILSLCDALERFEWKGHLGDFSLKKPRTSRPYLSRLTTLVVSGDVSECCSLLQLLDSTIRQPTLRAVELPSPIPLMDGPQRLFGRMSSIAIDRPISLQTFLSLLSLHSNALVTGRFIIEDDPDQDAAADLPNHSGMVCASLRDLDISSSATLARLWSTLIAPSLAKLALFFPREKKFSEEELQAFLCRSHRRIQSSHYDQPQPDWPVGYLRYTLSQAHSMT